MISQRLGVGACVFIFVGSACLQDFDRFRPTGEGGSTSTGEAGSTSTGMTDTTTSTGASTSDGGSGGVGSTTNTTTTTSVTSTTVSTGSSMMCGAGKKMCGADCVDVDDPQYGCGTQDDDCSPCVLDHATAKCSATHVCVVDSCSLNYENCNNVDSDGCEANTMSDVDACGGCGSPCATVTGATCMTGACKGPCGTVPASGLQLCWDYGGTVSATQYVGLAGGLADPTQGQQINEVFVDPLYVSSTIGQGFVLYDLGAPASNWDMQFRAGLHTMPGNGTITGTWDCTMASCAGSVFVYQDGEEIGSLVTDVSTGVVSTVPHYDPPYLLNVKVTLP